MLHFIARKWTEMLNHWQDYPLRKGMKWQGRYRIERFLGMGSYGQAYACHDLQSGQSVLLKRSKPSKGELGRRLLERESFILQELLHPQIPRWYGYERMAHEDGLIMELIDGSSMEDELQEHGRTYAVLEALYVLQNLLQPLKELHRMGFVHRDVRIPNVLHKQGVMYLIDYGLACRIGEELPLELREQLKEMPAASEALSDSWAAVKRRMREPHPTSDLYGLGHLFLFLMYAGYEASEDLEDRGWEEELGLPEQVISFVRKLLMTGEESYLSDEQCEQELERLIAELEGPSTVIRKLTSSRRR
ncbi:serine/threonine protein kinase [Paenibacillus harenae]|uniref:non-specific serine/threonine protein kinase n=1 Tax=Paenibacillus harenae TaxID=306543 RepID=A0ABT9U4W4_PAEHA|nr:protein kinase family protein [Paenibacillus harenae]MDQ0062320.1 serine/threonine-protein kinase [Paenibacillus harenae]MDQ0114677.1 serine/threonine-protein kinase [Paenibacillus harenae]